MIFIFVIFKVAKLSRNEFYFKCSLKLILILIFSSSKVLSNSREQAMPGKHYQTACNTIDS